MTDPTTRSDTPPFDAGREPRPVRGSHGTVMGLRRPTAQASQARQLVMVIEIHDAIRRHPDNDHDWIATVDSAVSVLHGIVTDNGGEPAVLLGSRLVVTFGADQAASVFDVATLVQAAATSPTGAGSWRCSIGIASSERHDEAGLGALGLPLVAPGVERAMQLCAWAQAGAVLADEATIVPAFHEGSRDDADGRSGGSGRSGRRWDLGSPRVLVGHDTEMVEFREVLVDTSPSPSPTSPSQSPSPSRSSPAPPAGSPRARRPTRPQATRSPDRSRSAGQPVERADGWRVGFQSCWFPDKGRGVIATNAGEEFYTDRRFVVGAVDVPDLVEVYFVAREPIAEGRNPVAGAVLVEGTMVDVCIDNVGGRAGVSARVADDQGTSHSLAVDLSGVRYPVRAGEWIRARITAGAAGPVAVARGKARSGPAR